MKPVEDAFGSESFRRVILPGIVLAAGVHPLISILTSPIDSLYGIEASLLLLVEIIFFGLIVSSCPCTSEVRSGERFQVLVGRPGDDRLQLAHRLGKFAGRAPARGLKETNRRHTPCRQCRAPERHPRSR